MSATFVASVPIRLPFGTSLVWRTTPTPALVRHALMVSRRGVFYPQTTTDYSNGPLLNDPQDGRGPVPCIVIQVPSVENRRVVRCDNNLSSAHLREESDRPRESH